MLTYVDVLIYQYINLSIYILIIVNKSRQETFRFFDIIIVMTSFISCTSGIQLRIVYLNNYIADPTKNKLAFRFGSCYQVTLYSKTNKNTSEGI